MEEKTISGGISSPPPSEDIKLIRTSEQSMQSNKAWVLCFVNLNLLIKFIRTINSWWMGTQPDIWKYQLNQANLPCPPPPRGMTQPYAATLYSHIPSHSWRNICAQDLFWYRCTQPLHSRLLSPTENVASVCNWVAHRRKRSLHSWSGRPQSPSMVCFKFYFID